MSRLSCFYIVTICLFSCTESKESYISYLNNPQNGLKKSFQSSTNAYQMLYQPIELMAIREAKATGLTKKEVIAELGSNDYFLLLLRKEEESSQSESDFYYAYQFENDIYQLIEGDTVRPSIYQLEQGISGKRDLRINLGFPKFEKDRNIFVKDEYGESFSMFFSNKAIAEVSKKRLSI